MILGPGLKEAESGKRNPGLPFRDIRKRFSEMAPPTNFTEEKKVSQLGSTFATSPIGT